MSRPGELSNDSMLAQLRSGDRVALGRAITLVESTKAADRSAARELLRAAMQTNATTVRIGITGIPGVGKSTLIDALGSELIANGHRVRKRQPDGMLVALGRSPVRMIRRRLRCSTGSGTGTADSSAALYGCLGAVTTGAESPISTICPRYITATRVAIWRTTARSWAMKR